MGIGKRQPCGCPALLAEGERINAENAVIESFEKVLGVELYRTDDGHWQLSGYADGRLPSRMAQQKLSNDHQIEMGSLLNLNQSPEGRSIKYPSNGDLQTMTKTKRGRPLVLTERGRKYTIYCTPAEREAIRKLLAALRTKPSK